jgi:hypothetical protein
VRSAGPLDTKECTFMPEPTLDALQQQVSILEGRLMTFESTLTDAVVAVGEKVAALADRVEAHSLMLARLLDEDQP